MISGAGLCWQHVGGVGSTTTTTTSSDLSEDHDFSQLYIVLIVSREMFHFIFALH